MVKLAPSILSADYGNLGKELQILHDSSADYIHIDIMDGVYVPAISFGASVVKSIRKYTDKIFDVHLMIQNPDTYIKAFVDAGADIITVHAEACVHLHRTIQNIRKHGVKAGVVLNPATSLSALEYILEEIDMVLLMSVNPGFGGQEYIESITRKIAELKKILVERKLPVEIEVDGGIKLNNVRTVIDAGADVIVAGSSIFNGDIIQNIHDFKRILDEKEK